jgi:hypothetical protein
MSKPTIRDRAGFVPFSIGGRKFEPLTPGENPPAKPEARMTGLGDLVAKVAQPIARAIDAVAGTNIKGCGGCKSRQEALNKAVPFNTAEKS